MALISSANLNAYMVLALDGTQVANTNYTLGVLPVGYVPLRITIHVNVAGTGSSSPLFSIGTSGSLAKYKASGALTVSTGPTSYTVVGAAKPTSEETLVLYTGATGTWPTAFTATLIVELMRVAG